MTDLDGKVILLTGATDGLGRALAAELARGGATVLVHGRDPARIAATVAEVAEAAGSPDRVRSYQADLASLARVRDLADQVLADELQAAGVMVNALHPATFMPTKMVPVSPRSTIAEGVEATWRLIAAPAVGTGRYYNGLRAARADDQAYDLEGRRRLRALSDELTGLG